ncbi:hypothetical protein NC981_00985 [Leptolyngbya sp. DQ-M1]|uniref:hypothetical protein n=1 Tax=Leptolyngbya sp. DQ-M1 TaxID=2933920 RepID=UPI00329A5263
MTQQALANYFSLHRRYHRSINLERDFDKPDAIEGYVLTERSTEALQRIVTAIGNPKTHHAWTITGTYGSGKSAFALYLTALCTPEDSSLNQAAWEVAERTLPENSTLFEEIATHIPSQGLLCAVVAGAREPLSWTIIRALANAVRQIWSRKRKPEAMQAILDWDGEISVGRCQVTDQQVLTAIQQLSSATSLEVLLIIDELGKNLQYASYHRSTEDLYLLQQIAELRHEEYQVYFLGLLHQSFVGYSEALSAIEQNEWTKIQGRFENLQLTESPSQMTRLIGMAIEQSDSITLVCAQQAQNWHQALQSTLIDQEISAKILASTYPLHPLTALVLPLLCTRYAQNDRSLFTFLTSDEPHALARFLQIHQLEDDRFSTLKLHQLYDYFVESVAGLASQVNLQRWVEIQGLIQDARSQDDEDFLKLLKTIGILNLITSTGSLKATPDLVALALCDRPGDQAALKHWREQIDALKKRGTIIYRSQADELRIWEGSDFDVEAAIVKQIEEQARVSLAELLSTTHPLKPIVAQRHYTTTGNLRYFEQRYVDSLVSLTELQTSIRGADGLIVYWLDTEAPVNVPARTLEGRPLILVTTTQLDLLRIRSQHLQALKTIKRNAPELTSDGVAQREVTHRLVSADRLLNETMQQSFNWVENQNQCWVEGEPRQIVSTREFQVTLSDVCDRTYPVALRLDNELINRRELTSQGAKARRELIEAMLKSADLERLGLQGYGPEVAMYFSVLEATGIHRQERGEWGFYPPHSQSGVETVWEKIESFCTAATDQQRSLSLLYHELALPPYGVKAGALPLLLAAFLLHRAEDIGVYKDGTFIPVLGPEHFELLVKAPERFSVKHFEIAGLRSQVFQQLETVLKSPNSKTPTGVRNASLLAIAKPLFKFVRQLPQYTLRTQRLSQTSQQVLQALQTAQEPDELLFSSLPKACGFEPIAAESLPSKATAEQFRDMLVQCIHEIQTAYETLLRECQAHLHEAFTVRSKQDNLREDLRVRASYLVGSCIEPRLKRFVLDAVDETTTQTEWLEKLVMTVSDKPPRTWSDEDFIRFERDLSDLARRFQNLETLQREIRKTGKGFEALKLTVSEADGNESHEVVWGDDEQVEQIETLISQILDDHPILRNNSGLQKFFAAKLGQYVLKRTMEESQNEIAQAKKRSKRAAV